MDADSSSGAPELVSNVDASIMWAKLARGHRASRQRNPIRQVPVQWASGVPLSSYPKGHRDKVTSRTRPSDRRASSRRYRSLHCHSGAGYHSCLKTLVQSNTCTDSARSTGQRRHVTYNQMCAAEIQM
jgi:hypothetical protein